MLPVGVKNQWRLYFPAFFSHFYEKNAKIREKCRFFAGCGILAQAMRALDTLLRFCYDDLDSLIS